MDHHFWHQAWQVRRIGFNQSAPHTQLRDNFNRWSKDATSVMVPLAGKSIDMIWLRDQGLEVTGVELSPTAVQEFFSENNLQPIEEGHSFKTNNITLYCCDYLTVDHREQYDLIYDRAALVALPKEMRSDYVNHSLNLLKPGGRVLLVSFEYDQEKVSGPPFSVDEKEISALYQDCQVELVHKKSEKPTSPKFVDGDVQAIFQKTYLITKN